MYVCMYVCMYVRKYHPGEPLDGVFDFTAGKLRCYQVRRSIYICTYVIHTYVHTYIRTYIHIYIRKYIQVSACLVREEWSYNPNQGKRRMIAR